MPKARANPMTFRINGGTVPLASPIPPVAQRIIATLRDLPDGELVDIHRLCALAQVSISAVRSSLGYAEFQPHKARWKGHAARANLYGNAKTIRLYQAQSQA